MNKRILILTLFLAIVAALAIVIIKNKQTHIKLPTHKTIDINGQPTLNANSKTNIQIVAFEDLKCSNCKRYNLELYPDIKKQYIDTGKASYTTVTLAFIPGSEPAANAALCLAEQDTNYYYQFADYVFAYQPDERLDWATPKTLLAFARHVPGANLTALESCMNSNRYAAKIQKNLLLAEIAMPERVATPTLFINGYKLSELNMKAVEQLIAATKYQN